MNSERKQNKQSTQNKQTSNSAAFEGEGSRPSDTRREPHVGDLWNIVKWVLILIGSAIAIGGVLAGNVLQTAALVGLACFVGILSRLAQAEQHRYPR